MDPIQAWKLQQARLGNKDPHRLNRAVYGRNSSACTRPGYPDGTQRTVRPEEQLMELRTDRLCSQLRVSQPRWTVAFDMSDEDQDSLINLDECGKAFKRILGSGSEMPMYRLKDTVGTGEPNPRPRRCMKEIFDELDVLGKQKLDFRQFHKLAAELSQYMADNPKWAKEEEEKEEKEEKEKLQKRRERQKSDASDVFAILGIAKSKAGTGRGFSQRSMGKHKDTVDGRNLAPVDR
eukprot:s3223_g8.t1